MIKEFIRVKNLPVRARLIKPLGIVLLNDNIWDSLLPATQNFIKLHEEGHYVLNTSDEIKADTYAFIKMAGSEPCSLKKILFAVDSTLNKNFPQHAERYDNIVANVLDYDAKVYNNNKALTFMKNNDITSKIKNADDILLSLTVEYLKSKGVKKISDLPEYDRLKLLTGLFKTDKMKYLVKKTMSKENNFANFEGEFLNWEGPLSKIKQKKEIKKAEKETKKAEKELEKETKKEEKKLYKESDEFQDKKDKRKLAISKLVTALDPVVSKVAMAFGVPVPAGLIAGIGETIAPDVVDDNTDDTNKKDNDTGKDENDNNSENKDKMKKIYTIGGGIAGLILIIVILVLVFRPKHDMSN